MKNFLLMAAAATVIAVTPAMAQQESNTTLNASLGNLCVLGAPSVSSIALGTLIETTGQNAGRLRAIPNQSVTIPGAYCNYGNHKLTVAVTALSTGTGTPPNSFSRAVNFNAQAAGWSGPVSVTTGATRAAANPTNSDVVTSSAPYAGDVSVTLSNFTNPGLAANPYLITGTYSGSVLVTLGPNS